MFNDFDELLENYFNEEDESIEVDVDDEDIDSEEESVFDSEDLNSFDELALMSEETVICQETRIVNISTEGQKIRDQIDRIIADNCTKLTIWEKIRSSMRGTMSYAVKPSEVAAITNGIKKLFDCCHISNAWSMGTMNYISCVGVKGIRLYNFMIKLSNTAGNGRISLTFSERRMDFETKVNSAKGKKKSKRFWIPQEAVTYAIKNSKPEHALTITRTSIRCVKVAQGKYDATTVNESLYKVLIDKFGGALDNGEHAVFWNNSWLSNKWNQI